MVPNKKHLIQQSKKKEKKKTTANSVHKKKKKCGHPDKLSGCHLKTDAWKWDEFIKIHSHQGGS